MSQLLKQSSIRKAGAAAVTKRRTEWRIVTSSGIGGSVNISEFVAVGGAHGNLYLSKNAKDDADSPGVVELSYTGAGAGPSVGLLPASINFSMTQMPSEGHIYHGPLGSGKDLEPEDLTGPCVVCVGSASSGFGFSETVIFFRVHTFLSPANCKAYGIVGGLGVTLPGVPSSSAMYYLGHLRVSQVNPEILEYKESPEPLNLRQPNFQVVPLALPADVLFDFDRAVLKPSAESILQNTAQFLAKQRVKSVIIEGHTDSKGTDQYNLWLSTERANAVKNWLVRHQASNATSLVAKGVGKSQPVAPNIKPDGSDNPGGRQQNRRVSVILVP